MSEERSTKIYRHVIDAMAEEIKSKSKGNRMPRAGTMNENEEYDEAIQKIAEPEDRLRTLATSDPHGLTAKQSNEELTEIAAELTRMRKKEDDLRKLIIEMKAVLDG